MLVAELMSNVAQITTILLVYLLRSVEENKMRQKKRQWEGKRKEKKCQEKHLKKKEFNIYKK